MNDGIITDLSNEIIETDIVSVSENDVVQVPEDAPADDTENDVSVQEVSETVSGNDVVAVSIVDVSGNEVFSSYDDSGLLAEIQILNDEVSALNSSLKELYTVVIGISSALTLLVFFTLFKWCEQKIKRFAKGVFNKYE